MPLGSYIPQLRSASRYHPHTDSIVTKSHTATKCRSPNTFNISPKRRSEPSHRLLKAERSSRSLQEVFRGESAPWTHGASQPHISPSGMNVPLEDVSAAGLLRLYPNPSYATEHYTEHQPYAASPPCLFLFSLLCFRADGLSADLILRSPPKYSHVQIKTSANWNMIYIHMIPVY